MSKQEEYVKVCFSLNEKQEELLKIGLDTFVFNPNINSLIEEISELEQLKKKLEREMEENNEG